MNSLLFGGSVPAVKTLGERVEWILEHRRTPTGDRWTARGLSDAAGLSPAYVGLLKRGAVKAPRIDGLRAIAEAAGVSAGWLASGEGTPDSDDDSRPPASTDSEVPHMGNALGWPDAEAAVRAKTAFPEEVWEATRKVAPYAIRGIVTESDALELVSMVAKFRDPARMEKQLAEAYQRQKEVLARVEARAAQKGKS